MKQKNNPHTLPPRQGSKKNLSKTQAQFQSKEHYHRKTSKKIEHSVPGTTESEVIKKKKIPTLIN